MANHETSSASDPEEVRKIHAELHRKEMEAIEKTDRMLELARSIGAGGDIWDSRRLSFKTWQEAWDFQEFCKEQGFEVRFTEPPKKPANRMNFMEDYYHVYPK